MHMQIKSNVSETNASTILLCFISSQIVIKVVWLILSFTIYSLLVDTGDETKLHELKKTITDNPTCANKWGAGNIMDTHICVGNGDKGACNVSHSSLTVDYDLFSLLSELFSCCLKKTIPNSNILNCLKSYWTVLNWLQTSVLNSTKFTAVDNFVNWIKDWTQLNNLLFRLFRWCLDQNDRFKTYFYWMSISFHF